MKRRGFPSSYFHNLKENQIIFFFEMQIIEVYNFEFFKKENLYDIINIKFI